VGVGLLIAPPVVQALPQEAQSTTGIGKPVTHFELVDFRGKAWSLAEFQSSPVVVLAFLGTECPLAKLYSHRLQGLATRFADRQVTFLAINPNVQDSLEKMSAFARRQELSIPFLKDPGAKVADEMGATRTPEVVVLNAQRQIVYRGRVDDQYGIGYVRKEPQATELVDAIEATLEQKPVAVPFTSAVGCLIGRNNKPESQTDITYASHTAAILNDHCVRCHREGQIGPFALDNYADAAAWSDMIAEVVQEQIMPPWHADPKFGTFANDCSLSPENKKTLLSWIDAGSPEGDATTTPASPEFMSGWQLPRAPDFTCKITERPVQVPATGDVRYKYFIHDPKFAEDKWVSAAELRPGNLEVVHHILCFILPPGATELEQELDGFLVGYVPGMLPPQPRQGYAKRVEAGSKFVFQVHYTPNGRSTTDHGDLGLVFADPAKVTHAVVTTCAVNPRIEIPAHASNHAEEAWNRAPLGNWEILSLMPHLHLRGKAFRYEAVYPGGDREVLLDVPRFDFNWQTSYQLAKPKTIPAGTKIYCLAVYDNSEGNLSNPKPDVLVRWGDQTWEEMMVGYFDMAIPKDEAAQLNLSRR
jgi:peroxiredoxin